MVPTLLYQLFCGYVHTPFEADIWCLPRGLPETTPFAFILFPNLSNVALFDNLKR